jgi:protein-S-isoprenylcysteine O-methyltransferase Ste14
MTQSPDIAPEDRDFLPALAAVFNFAVILPIAMVSGSYGIGLWDFIFVAIGAGVTVRFVRYLSAAYQFPETHIKAEKANRFATEGIYGKMRHPVSAALMYMNIAYVFLFRSFSLIPVVPVFCALYYAIAKARENVLIQRFGDRYLSYMQATGMFRGGSRSRDSNLSGYAIN